MNINLDDALNFSGRSVVITGGSDGIGYGVARLFERAGAAVTVTGTREASSYEQDFTGLRFIQLNVTDHASVEAFVGQVETLDVLVNAVGTVLYGSKEFEREGFDFVMDVNLNGVMDVCSSFKDKLAATKGCIINLDSIVAYNVARNNPSYSASKAGLKHLNKVLAWKWGKLGIRVNGIGPGAVPTKLTAKQMTAESEADFGKKVPAGRYGTPEDIGGAVMFLASPLAAYVTGVSFPVDGGLSLLSGL